MVSSNKPLINLMSSLEAAGPLRLGGVQADIGAPRPVSPARGEAGM